MTDSGSSSDAGPGCVFKRCDTAIAGEFSPIIEQRKSLRIGENENSCLVSNSMNRSNQFKLSFQLCILFNQIEHLLINNVYFLIVHFNERFTFFHDNLPGSCTKLLKLSTGSLQCRLLFYQPCTKGKQLLERK